MSMSLYDVIFWNITPTNRKKLLAICEKKIASGENQKAISLAIKYIKRGVCTTSRSREQSEQKDLDMGCSYYLIAKALFNNIKADPDFRTYKYFKVFFHAHFHAYGVFQDFTQESEYYSYFKQTEFFYKELYDAYGDNPDIERADRDANNEIRAARSAAKLESLGLEGWI